MTLQKKIVIEASLIAFILDVILFNVKNYRWSDLFDIEIYFIFLLFPAIIIFIPIVVSFFVSSLFNGRYVKMAFLRFLFWTLVPSFFLGLWLLYEFDQSSNYKYRAFNVQHNNKYFPFYGDARDASISLAISSLQSALSDKGDYRLKRLRVLELDTLYKGKLEKYYDIQQIYCLGKMCNDENTYASRQLVFNNEVKNMFLKKSINESVGARQYRVIESIVEKMVTQKSFDSVSEIAGDLIIDVVKIRE